jgi:hypothetical protein
LRTAPIFPFLRPGKGRVKVLAWTRGETADLLPDKFPDWDANTSIEAGCRVTVDVPALLADCNLPSEALLAMGLGWHCSSTALRGCGPAYPINVADRPIEIAVFASIPGSAVAGAVELQGCLFLKDSTSSSRASPLSATLAGSLLWTDEKTIVLEGTGSRFPVELADFSSMPWLPSDAGWYLEWNAGAPEDLVLSSMRLLVNSSNKLVAKAALAMTDGDPVTDVVLEAMYLDVGEQLICGLLGNPEFVSRREAFPPGTVGRHVSSLLRVHFPADSADSLAQALKRDASLFRARLQAAFRTFIRSTA